MKKPFLVFITMFFITNSFSQNNDKTYLAHDHNYSSVYSYHIREIIIHQDSTYTFKNYTVSNKKEWKTYKQYIPEISKGFILKKGKFLMLTENKDTPESFFSWTVKIKDKKLIFFLPNRRGKMRRTFVYKRIDIN